MLVLNAVSVQIAQAANPLFSPITAEVAGGEILTIMGPSGSGKSSLLDHIGGHLAPSLRPLGTIALSGMPLDGLPAEKRHIGLMFQDATLFPHLSVAQNLAFGLRVKTRAAREQAIREALTSVGLDGFGPRDPATLSGGEKTRVALMRALLAAPQALLLDEPFSNLDFATRASVRRLVFDHIRASGLPAILVSHDPADPEAAGGAVISLR